RGPLRHLHPRHLIGVHGARTADRHIFAGDETLLAEPEADLVVALAFLVVEIPLTARLAPQAADPVLLALAELPHAAHVLMRLPLRRVEPPLRIERHQQIVAFLAVAFGAPLL